MSANPKHIPVRLWVAQSLAADVAGSIQRVARADDVVQVAVMPDVHLANQVCVGLVVATERLIYPAAVGNDIGCGMAAIRIEASAERIRDEALAAQILSGLYRCVPSLKHPASAGPRPLPADLQDILLSDSRLEKLKARDGRWQLGTLGRGNHFLEFQADPDDQLWLMVHSGSRGIGQAIALHHLASASQERGGKRLASFDAESKAGQAYLADLAWARRYAALNRLAMLQAVGELLSELCGVDSVAESLFHRDHNHVQRETHFGKPYWVHRKGAQSAFEGEAGIIPGSMGTASFHVVGRGHAAALCSSSHGAGRTMSRADASRTITERRLHREMQGIWFDHRLSRRLRDEAPSAYKDVHSVMRAQRELTRIERELQPLLSYKGC